MKEDKILIREDIRRILVIRLAKTGDVLLTTPFVRNLRSVFPAARIDYIVGRVAGHVLRGNPHISELIISDKKIFSKIVKKRSYDLAIDFMGVEATARLCRLSGARYRAGIYGRDFGDYNILLDKPPRNTSVTDYFLSLFKKIGIKNYKHYTPEINLISAEKKYADNRLRRLKNRIIGIQPACDLKGRLWPATNFARLGDSLAKKYRSDVIIFQGPGEEKVALKMKECMKEKVNLMPVLSLRRYLAILSRCALFIANEGGQLHMAMALRVPTIGLFCSLDHKYWFFYKNKFRKILSKNMRGISVIKVLREVEKLDKNE